MLQASPAIHTKHRGFGEDTSNPGHPARHKWFGEWDKLNKSSTRSRSDDRYLFSNGNLSRNLALAHLICVIPWLLEPFSGHAIMFCVVPGIVIWMTPAQLHMHLQVFCSPGIPRTSTVGEPGTQGAVVTGMHGMGVKTPKAAAVAAATMGLAKDWHSPKGGMFTMGT